MTTNTDGAMPEPPVVAWMTIKTLDGKKKLERGECSTNPRYPEVHTEWAWEPLVRLSDARAAIQQAAGAVPEGPTPRDWRTIETAPTHVDVLACNPCGFVGRAYKDSKGRWNHIGNPTHWMPLPAAPTKDYQHLEEREAYDQSMRGFFNADGTPLLELAALNEKWKFVPVVPTEEMLTAAKGGAVFDQTMESLYRKGLLKNWADMLAASPSPPKQQPVHLVGGEGGGVPLTDDGMNSEDSLVKIVVELHTPRQEFRHLGVSMHITEAGFSKGRAEYRAMAGIGGQS